MSAIIEVILGRDGINDLNEADYTAWVSYFAKHVDERVGFEVEVEYREETEQDQTDRVRILDGSHRLVDEKVKAVRLAIQDLWDAFCADDGAWPSRKITDEQLLALRAEALRFNDEQQVTLCSKALAGDAAARLECATVINDAGPA